MSLPRKGLAPLEIPQTPWVALPGLDGFWCSPKYDWDLREARKVGLVCAALHTPRANLGANQRANQVSKDVRSISQTFVRRRKPRRKTTPKREQKPNFKGSRKPLCQVLGVGGVGTSRTGADLSQRAAVLVNSTRTEREVLLPGKSFGQRFKVSHDICFSGWNDWLWPGPLCSTAVPDWESRC
jgi:hypothetical protein